MTEDNPAIRREEFRKKLEAFIKPTLEHPTPASTASPKQRRLTGKGLPTPAPASVPPIKPVKPVSVSTADFALPPPLSVAPDAAAPTEQPAASPVPAAAPAPTSPRAPPSPKSTPAPTPTPTPAPTPSPVTLTPLSLKPIPKPPARAISPRVALPPVPATNKQGGWDAIDWNLDGLHFTPEQLAFVNKVRAAGDGEIRYWKQEHARLQAQLANLVDLVSATDPNKPPSAKRRSLPAPVLPALSSFSKEDVVKVVHIQKLVRGFLLRRNMRRLALEYLKSDATKKLRHRNEVVREVYSTEKTYNSCLTILVEKFLTPLVRAVDEGLAGPMTQDHINKISIYLSLVHFDLVFCGRFCDQWEIFSNLISIQKYNELILKALHEEFKAWPAKTIQLGHVFYELAPFLKLYSTYVNNYNQALSTLEWCNKNSTISSFIKQLENEPSCNHLGLQALLIMPVQRIPRYVLLLKELIKFTEDDHPDKPLLTKAYEKISAIAEEINEKKRHAETADLLYRLEQSVHDCPSLLGNVNRRLVKEGNLSKPGSVIDSKKRLYLFNDMLVCVHSSVVGKQHCEIAVPLKDITFEAGDPNTDDFKLVWHKEDGALYELQLEAESVEEKNQWVTTLQHTKDEAAKEK